MRLNDISAFMLHFIFGLSINVVVFYEIRDDITLLCHHAFLNKF